MFDRFTERARKVMTLSRQEAQRLGQDCIGTEHILLGLVQEGSGIGAKVLGNFKVDLHRARSEVERIVKKGNHPALGTQLPFTMGSKHVLEFALEEAQDLGHNYIGTEHLLLGLLREEKGPGAMALATLGIRIKEVRAGVVGLIGGLPAYLLVPEVLPTVERGTPLEIRPSEGARAVLAFARDEAVRLRNDYLGTEHLLLGLCGAATGAAGQSLRDLGMDLMKVRAEIERLVEQGTSPANRMSLPVTPRLRRVLEFAEQEAGLRGHGWIGPEHLLLALVREEDGPAAHVLQSLGVGADAVRSTVAGELAFAQPEGPPATEAQKAESAGLAGEAAAAVSAALPGETVQVSTLFHSSNLGFGHHLLLLWREGPAEPILASVSAVAWNAESVRAEIPALVESLKRLIERERAADS